MKIKEYLEANHSWSDFSSSYELTGQFQSKNKTPKPQRKDDSKSKERKVDYGKQRQLKRSV